MNRKLVAVGFLLVSPLAGAEDIAYVTDILRLGIHQAQDTSDRPFQNLLSGTELTVLDRVPNYAHVRTNDGQEGWVKSAYLVTDKPAQLRVAEMEAEIETLRTQLAAAKAAREAAETEAHRIAQEMNASVDSSGAARETLARLQQENAAFEQRFERYRGAIPLAWVAGAILVALVAGFFCGFWWLDSSIRKRFGGFRIY